VGAAEQIAPLNDSELCQAIKGIMEDLKAWQILQRNSSCLPCFWLWKVAFNSLAWWRLHISSLLYFY